MFKKSNIPLEAILLLGAEKHPVCHKHYGAVELSAVIYQSGRMVL